MAIRGSLREASLPDVLQLLALGKKTGCLSVTDRSSFGYIYFDKGRITYATIVNRRDRLGEILVKNGVVTSEALQEAVAAQGAHNKRLGQVLVERELLSADDLKQYIHVQIEEAVFYLFTWTQGTFSFDAGVLPDDRESVVSINPESLLLEGARRVDEWSLIEKKVPSFDIIFAVDRARLKSSEVVLTPEQERLARLIDGKRDVTVLIDESGLGEFDVGKALYGLATAGFLERVGQSRVVQETASSARVEEHRNLGVAFYKTGMLEEAMRELRRVGELRPHDSHARFYIGLVAMRRHDWSGAAAIFKDLSTHPAVKPAVYHNLAYALERLGRLDEALVALDDAVANGAADDALVRTSRGVVELRRGEASLADGTLSSARAHFGKRAPSAAWFHYSALAAAMTGDLDRAVALCGEGLASHPHSAALHNTHATIQERRGDSQAAIQAAESGLREDSNLPQLHKNLGDCLYRAGRYDEATDAYERAAKLDDQLGADVYFKLGNIRYKKQDREHAIAYWERALALEPSNDLIRNNLDLVRSVMA